MPKAADQSTRDRILRAAVEEIAEKGWGGARTRSIAERADVNSALIHYHFSSIEDLLIEAVSSAFAGIATAAAESVTADTIALGLEGMLDALAAIDPNDAEWQVLMEAIMQSPRVPRLSDLTLGFLETYRSALQDRLAEAVAAGELPADADCEGLALGLMALLDGLGLYAFVNPDYDTARAGRSIVTLITGGST